MITAWQKQREDFNHKWLKNDLMMALGSWPKLLDGIDEDPTRHPHCPLYRVQ